MIHWCCRWKAAGHCTYGRRFGLSLPKGGEKMPITLTFHVFGLTFTIRIKKQNRHLCQGDGFQKAKSLERGQTVCHSAFSMDIIAHCRAAVKEPGSAFFIKKRAVFCQEPPRRSGPRERAGFHGIPSLRWNKWQSSYKSNDTSFNIDCLPTWQSSPDWQTTYFASWAQVCHLGKVRFTALVR